MNCPVSGTHRICCQLGAEELGLLWSGEATAQGGRQMETMVVAVAMEGTSLG